MDERYTAYIITESFCIAYAVVIFLRVYRSKRLGREERTLLCVMASYIVMTLTDAIAIYVEKSDLQAMTLVSGCANGVSLAAVSMGCYYWFEFIELRLHHADILDGKLKTLLQVSILFICALNLISSFTGWIFFINADRQYQMGSLFWIQSLFCSAYLMIPTAQSLAAALQTPPGDKRKEYFVYVGYICFGYAIVYIEDSMPTTPILELGVLLCVQTLFMMLYHDRELDLARQERELSESRMDVMLSQIQPHFLYNALAVIQDMCSEKAPEAAQTTVEFAEFLRGNLDSLSRKSPIPFQQELHHTKNYLSLEQKRFGERLQVEYDIQADAFFVPALTLQPIVENAVQHGVSKREEGGTVRISTHETADSYIVNIDDNGVGFDPNEKMDGSRAHIGIMNVKKRLEILCGGTLDISSVPNQGTSAVITIPKTKALKKS